MLDSVYLNVLKERTLMIIMELRFACIVTLPVQVVLVITTINAIAVEKGTYCLKKTTFVTGNAILDIISIK